MSAPTAETIWDRARLGITIGTVALIFLAAIEALAVTTVMPVVADDLNGEALFAVAFSATLATGVIGMVAAGAWSDRAGPRAPLYAAVLLFAIGLLVSGFALDMYTFVVGRLIQGLGAGGQTVALYVVVARVYPRHLHGPIFAAYAAAWVVPSMIGPFLAGAVTEFLHWRWAFLGVAVLTALAFALVYTRLRGVSLAADAGEVTEPRVAAQASEIVDTGVAGASGAAVEAVAAPRTRMQIGVGRRMLLAVIVASSAVAVGFSADVSPSIGVPLAAACIVVITVALLPLLPKGTLKARSGLPSVVLMRGVAAGAFFAAEAYVPKLLIDQHDFSPSLAGLALTLAAVGWSSGSAVQGRWGDRLGSIRIAWITVTLMLAGIVGVLWVSVGAVPAWIVVVAWGLAGTGMGLLYPRLTVLTLAYSTTADEGFNSSALSISDSTGSAVTIAMAGLGFALLPIAGSGYITVYVLAAALIVLALLPGLRMGDAGR